MSQSLNFKSILTIGTAGLVVASQFGQVQAFEISESIPTSPNSLSHKNTLNQPSQYSGDISYFASSNIISPDTLEVDNGLIFANLDEDLDSGSECLRCAPPV